MVDEDMVLGRIDSEEMAGDRVDTGCKQDFGRVVDAVDIAVGDRIECWHMESLVSDIAAMPDMGSHTAAVDIAVMGMVVTVTFAEEQSQKTSSE
jgi:hypothetical protein